MEAGETQRIGEARRARLVDAGFSPREAAKSRFVFKAWIDQILDERLEELKMWERYQRAIMREERQRNTYFSVELSMGKWD